jgi:hypothetical protein
VYPITFDPYQSAGFLRGLRNPADYRIKIVGPGQGQSVQLAATRRTTLPARPTNVQVFRVLTDGTEVPVEYAFWDITGPDFISPVSTEPATFSADPALGESDILILVEPQVGNAGGDPVVTWRLGLNFVFPDRENPSEGDVAEVITRKPFLSNDVFEFETMGSGVDTELAADQLDQIRVVPNPYVATNRFEGLNPFNTGRGPRVIKFTRVPPECTVRIYTVSGRLVRELRHNEGSNAGMTPGSLLDGTVTWDLESDDNLTVSYGVYLYHIEAPGIGETTGTFAIIK